MASLPANIMIDFLPPGCSERKAVTSNTSAEMMSPPLLDYLQDNSWPDHQRSPSSRCPPTNMSACPIPEHHRIDIWFPETRRRPCCAWQPPLRTRTWRNAAKERRGTEEGERARLFAKRLRRMSRCMSLQGSGTERQCHRPTTTEDLLQGLCKDD